MLGYCAGQSTKVVGALPYRVPGAASILVSTNSWQCLPPLPSDALRMQMLQSLHADFSPLKSGNSFGGGACSRERSDGRNPRSHGGSPDGLLVEERIGAVRSIDDQLDAIAFNQVDDVRPSFFHLVNALHAEPGVLDDVRGAGGRDQLESHVDEAARHLGHTRLIVVGDAYEHRALRGQFLPGSDLRLGER